MALVLDDTLAGGNSNTYISLADAEIYFESALYGSDWDTATTDIKNKALVSATRRINYETFDGDRKTSTQALAFPRVNLPYLDGISIDNIIPKNLLEATCELALFLIGTNPNTNEVIAPMSGVKVGSVDIKYHIDKSENASIKSDTLPPDIISLLSPFTKTISSGGMVFVSR